MVSMNKAEREALIAFNEWFERYMGSRPLWDGHPEEARTHLYELLKTAFMAGRASSPLYEPSNRYGE